VDLTGHVACQAGVGDLSGGGRRHDEAGQDGKPVRGGDGERCRFGTGRGRSRGRGIVQPDDRRRALPPGNGVQLEDAHGVPPR
jgi:hypothetical protein